MRWLPFPFQNEVGSVRPLRWPGKGQGLCCVFHQQDGGQPPGLAPLPISSLGPSLQVFGTLRGRFVLCRGPSSTVLSSGAAYARRFFFVGAANREPRGTAAGRAGWVWHVSSESHLPFGMDLGIHLALRFLAITSLGPPFAAW